MLYTPRHSNSNNKKLSGPHEDILQNFATQTPIPPYNLPQGSLLLSLMIGVGCCLLCILEKLLKLLLLRF